MCYKEEVQKHNKEKLQQTFQKDGTPEFIQRLLSIMGRSAASSITYWSAIRDMLQYMIDHNVITKEKIADIVPEDMSEIEAPDMQKYFEYKKETGLASTTLQTRKNMFISFWKKMISTKKIPVDSNIVKEISFRGQAYNPNNVLAKLPTEEELKDMVNKIKNKKDMFVRERNLTIMLLLMTTGLREHELAGLDLRHLHLDDKPSYVTIVGKGAMHEEESRTVFLSEEETVYALVHWIDIRNDMEIIVDTDALFLSKNGKRMKEENIKAMFRNYSQERISPHKIRHWYASVFAKRYNELFVQQQLGHRSLNTTINNYMDARQVFLKNKRKEGMEILTCMI